MRDGAAGGFTTSPPAWYIKTEKMVYFKLVTVPSPGTVTFLRLYQLHQEIHKGAK